MSGFQWFLLIVGLLTAWYLIYEYSKRHYDHLACRACNGGGKIWEPVWMAWVLFRRRRAFRLCTACGGSARYVRRGARR